MISLSSQGAAALQQARAQLAAALRKDPGVDDLLARFDRWGPDLWNGLVGAYDAETVLPRFVELIAQAHRDRSKELRARDRERLLQPDWFQRPEAIGYVAYADRFAGDLAGVQSHIDYLSDLGVTYLHLMPLLEPRPAPNDGGYAVMDYRKVRSDLGTMKNLRELAGALHEAGIALTLDLVLNHVAQEHAWAVAARKGDAAKRDYFLTYPDRTLPDEYEKSLPEVFPAFAPGNFTW
ncbi:MAG: alpha-amylase family glycosyl hydrolase, partial [Actinomycetes bacterium]